MTNEICSNIVDSVVVSLYFSHVFPSLFPIMVEWVALFEYQTMYVVDWDETIKCLLCV